MAIATSVLSMPFALLRVLRVARYAHTPPPGVLYARTGGVWGGARAEHRALIPVTPAAGSWPTALDG